MSKPTTDDYGYDPGDGIGTGTVRFLRRDVERLLLEFRLLVEGGQEHMEFVRDYGWQHMEDYDESFERIADVLDATRELAYPHLRGRTKSRTLGYAAITASHTAGTAGASSPGAISRPAARVSGGMKGTWSRQCRRSNW